MPGNSTGNQTVNDDDTWNVTLAPGTPPQTIAKFRAASKALDALILADGLPAPDPDRWCWPHSEAMNGAEIGAFTARLARFTGKGVSLADAEALADRLVQRDRGEDDRRLCVECVHLAGHSATSWNCRNWQQAEIAIRSKDAQLPADLVRQLQRCGGFKETGT